MPLTPEQRAYQVQYRKKHAEKLRAYNVEYHRKRYQKNREKRLAQTAEYQKSHPEVNRKAAREWARRNKERHLANTQKWRAANVDRERLAQRLYRQKHKARISERYKAYSKNNLPLRASITAKRRALKLKTQVDALGISAWMKEVRSKPFARCHWCGTKVTGRNIHFDHVVALSKGGTHTIGNLCASCRECNLSKGNRLIADWLCGRQSFLPL